MESESLFNNCSACGKLISKSAPSCPQCGHKNARASKTKIIGLVLLGIIILAGTGSNTPKSSYESESQQTSTVTEETKPTDNLDKWQQDVSVSKIDDSTTVTLSLSANNKISGWLISTMPTLYIRCKENVTDLFIVTNTNADIEDIYGKYTVEIRLDKGTAFKQKWSASTDSSSLFAPNSISLTQKIANAEKMAVRFTPFNASQQIMEFDVAGLAKHLELVAKTCKWSDINPKEKK